MKEQEKFSQEVAGAQAAVRHASTFGMSFVRGRPVPTLLTPALAVFTALVLGAVIIAAFDPDVAAGWRSFFRSPGGALGITWTTIRDAYLALFQGSFGSPRQFFEAIGTWRATGESRALLEAIRPFRESLVIATPYIFAGLAVAAGFSGRAVQHWRRRAAFRRGPGIGLRRLLTRQLALVCAPAAGAAGRHRCGCALGRNPRLAQGANRRPRGHQHDHDELHCLPPDGFHAPGWANGPLGWPADHARDQAQCLPASSLSQARSAYTGASSWRWRLRAWSTGSCGRRRKDSRFVWPAPTPVRARYAGVRITPHHRADDGAERRTGWAGRHQPGAGGRSQLVRAFSTGYGFDSIALALLGNSHPLGVVLASLLFGFLRGGAARMQSVASVPVEIIKIVQGMVIIFVAAPEIIRGLYRLKAIGQTDGLHVSGWRK